MKSLSVISTHIESIRQQVAELRKEHAEALRRAVYLGMTREEARTHEARLDAITKLERMLTNREPQYSPGSEQ